jgi:uncharacterized membrane protein
MVCLWLVLYTSSHLYKTGEIGDGFIYVCATPFLLVPLISIWALNRTSGRLVLSIALLANLIFLFVNLAGVYLSYIEANYRISKSFDRLGNVNWMLLIPFIATQLIFLSANFTAPIALMKGLKERDNLISV